jgi:hypothetical protein
VIPPLAFSACRVIPKMHPLKGPKMRLVLLTLFASFGLAGCTYSSSSPPPPAQGTTIVLPPGATVVCQNGKAPPC